MSTHSQKINTFLHYGYLPDPVIRLPNSLKSWLNGDLPKLDFESIKKKDLSEIGIKCLNKAFNEEIGEDSDKAHIVPLSGGLDSRAVLAGLLEFLDRGNIIAVTFGIPGSLDVKRAENIANHLGVKWDHINLSPNSWVWSTDRLIEAANLSTRPTRLFDNTVNQAIQLKYGREYIYWSGFMGDSLGRSPAKYSEVASWQEAKTKFSEKNKRGKSIALTKIDYNSTDCLPNQPYAPDRILDFYSQLHYCIRQQCFTKAIYSPKGYDIRYPFLNQSWVQYILSAPRNLRINQVLYLNILSKSWPNLFNNYNSLPREKSFWNKLMHASIKDQSIKFISMFGFELFPRTNVNYIDFNYALKNQNDFKNTVFENLVDLNKRKVIDWIDIDSLWLLHQNGKLDLSDELMTLTALEIHLKTERKELGDKFSTEALSKL